MTNRTLGRIALVMAVAAVLLVAIVAFLPAPAQVLAALLTLPVGASFFATATAAS